MTLPYAFNGHHTPAWTPSTFAPSNSQFNPTSFYSHGQGYNPTELGDLLRAHTTRSSANGTGTTYRDPLPPSHVPIWPPAGETTTPSAHSFRHSTVIPAQVTPALSGPAVQTTTPPATQPFAQQAARAARSYANSVTQPATPETQATPPLATQTTTLPPATVTALPALAVQTTTPSATQPPAGTTRTTLAPTQPVPSGTLTAEVASKSLETVASWRVRNPTRPVIPVRQVKKLSEEERIKRVTTRQNTAAKRQALESAVMDHIADNIECIKAIAEQHHVTAKYVTTLCTTASSYNKPRKPQLNNALVHAKALEVNKGKS